MMKMGIRVALFLQNQQVLDTHAIIIITEVLLCIKWTGPHSFVAYPSICYLWPWILNQNCHINLISPLKFLKHNFICMSIFKIVLFWGDYRFIWPPVMYICVIYLLILACHYINQFRILLGKYSTRIDRHYANIISLK